MRGLTIFKRFVALAIILSFSVSVFPQAKKPLGAKPAKPTAQKCSGAWVGTVKYTRTQTNTENKTTPRASMMGEDSTSREFEYKYKARVVVAESPQKDGSTRATATIKSKLSNEETTTSKEKVSCDRGKSWKTQSGEFKSESTLEGDSDGSGARVQVGINNDGTYNVSVAMDRFRGKKTGSYTANFSGQCTQKKNINETMPEGEADIQGNSMISDGSHRFDGKDPNIISGSYTQAGVAGMEETISWKLRRCGSPLMITEVEMYQPRHPSVTDWVKIDKGRYTIDGNMVKVVAKVANLSGQTKTTPIEFRELKEGALLPEGKMPISIEPNEEREIVYMWDTSGYAWKESGELNQPEIDRQVEVKITGDIETENVEVRPKPVIVIPGKWSDKYSFDQFMKYFENMRATHWKVDYARILPSESAAGNAPIVEQRIKEVQEHTNAWHVDLVGHSTGGLAGRVYINDMMGVVADGKPTVTNFVMVGTPNAGTPCAFGMDNIAVRFFNRIDDSFRELTNANMKDFNKRVKARKGTKFYGLVGHGYNKTCHMTTPGDGVVPAGSALRMVKTFKYTPQPSTHEFMLGESFNMKVIHQWLAISPKGNHKPDPEDYAGDMGEIGYMGSPDEFNRRNYGAMFHAAETENGDKPAYDGDIEPSFMTGVKLKPGQSTEIEIPVIDGKRLAINLMAPKNVSLTLVDSHGTILGSSLAGTPEAANTFRYIGVDKPFQKGTWKLKLESRETEESEIAVVMFIF